MGADEDPLARLHTHGFYVQRLLEMEYEDAARDETTWPTRKPALMGRWRRMAMDWAGAVETALGSDMVAVARFHNAQAPSALPEGYDIDWSSLRGWLMRRLEILGQAVESRRAHSGANITIGSIGGPGAVNLGTVHGGMNVSVRVLQDSGQGQLASLFAQLLEKIPTAANLQAGEIEEAAELAQGLAEETARRPSGGRLSAIGKAAATALGHIVTKSADLVRIWEAIEKVLAHMPPPSLPL